MLKRERDDKSYEREQEWEQVRRKALDIEIGGSRFPVPEPRSCRRLVPDSSSTSTSFDRCLVSRFRPPPSLLSSFRRTVGACLCEIVTAPTLRRLEGGRLHRLLHFSYYYDYVQYALRPLICHVPLYLTLLPDRAFACSPKVTAWIAFSILTTQVHIQRVFNPLYYEVTVGDYFSPKFVSHCGRHALFNS